MNVFPGSQGGSGADPSGPIWLLCPFTPKNMARMETRKRSQIYGPLGMATLRERHFESQIYRPLGMATLGERHFESHARNWRSDGRNSGPELISRLQFNPLNPGISPGLNPLSPYFSGLR